MQLNDYTGVIHLHSAYSFDGRTPIADIIAELLAKPANQKTGIPQLLQELLKRRYPVRVLYTVGHWLDINSIEDVVQAGNF